MDIFVYVFYLFLIDDNWSNVVSCKTEDFVT